MTALAGMLTTTTHVLLHLAVLLSMQARMHVHGRIDWVCCNTAVRMFACLMHYPACCHVQQVFEPLMLTSSVRSLVSAAAAIGTADDRFLTKFLHSPPATRRNDPDSMLLLCCMVVCMVFDISELCQPRQYILAVMAGGRA